MLHRRFVLLEIEYDGESYGNPQAWNWDTLLDLNKDVGERVAVNVYRSEEEMLRALKPFVDKLAPF